MGVDIGAVVAIVEASKELISAAADIAEDAKKSIVLEVVNSTSRTLRKIGNDFEHGGFGKVHPRPSIGPFQADVFVVQTSAFLQGVEGSVSYAAEGVGNFLVGFSNPVSGTNTVNVDADPAVVAGMWVIGTIGSGGHVNARFVVLDKGVDPDVQADWRSCPKCQGLHFAGFPGFKGVCPAGGAHEQTRSFDYTVIHHAQPSRHVQVGWRSCPKCQGMHFAGLPDFKGVCPAGGAHEQTGSFEYVFTFDTGEADHLQLDWRACHKCQGIFYGPFRGVCPAGGGHDPAGSFNYGVRFK
jgi:hypothetical protein